MSYLFPALAARLPRQHVRAIALGQSRRIALQQDPWPLFSDQTVAQRRERISSGAINQRTSLSPRMRGSGG